MRYGFVVTISDPRTVADLAREAEDAGWDAAFTWDGMCIGDEEVHDPWVTLAAMAMQTERIRIGALVTPPSRRRPWKLARETMSVDRLSRGRLIVPVGLGTLDDAGFGPVGEPTDRRVRAELLDESLEILAGLWRGEPFGFDGHHYRFPPMTFRPPTVQQPRPPVWVVAAWPSERSTARALRWDGLLPNTRQPDGTMGRPTVEDIAAIAAHVRARRAATTPFDLVVDGNTPADDPAAAAAEAKRWADAGATWWLEAPWGLPGGVETLRRRIAAGPPRG